MIIEQPARPPTISEDDRADTLGSPTAPALALRDFFKIYPEGPLETVALRGAGLTVAPGEFVASVGPSGSGKSTLLALATGLATPSLGLREGAHRGTPRDRKMAFSASALTFLFPPAPARTTERPKVSEK